MTIKQRKELVNIVHSRLLAKWGKLRCALDFSNPYQLLVAVMLSAQCRDERVNAVTPDFFDRWPDARALASADTAEVGKVICNCGLFRTKAKHLIAAAQKIVDLHNGEVPDTMEELTGLDGVGRKSANVLLGDAFNKPGFPVDTHVKRVARRIGIASTDDPEKTEREICICLAEEYWSNFSHLLIALGRQICHAGKKECDICPLSDICAENKKKSRKKF